MLKSHVRSLVILWIVAGSLVFAVQWLKRNQQLGTVILIPVIEPIDSTQNEYLSTAFDVKKWPWGLPLNADSSSFKPFINTINSLSGHYESIYPPKEAIKAYEQLLINGLLSLSEWEQAQVKTLEQQFEATLVSEFCTGKMAVDSFIIAYQRHSDTLSYYYGNALKRYRERFGQHIVKNIVKMLVENEGDSIYVVLPAAWCVMVANKFDVNKKAQVKWHGLTATSAVHEQ